MQKSILYTPIYLAALCGTLSAQAPATDEIAELRQQVEALSGKVGELEQKLNKARLTQPVFASPSADAGGGKALAAPVASTPEYVLPKETNLSLFNPEISAALDFIGSYSRRADNVNFIVRDAEIMIQANVDHLVHAYAVFNAETELAPMEKSDPFGEVKLGIEEAAIETTDLPWGSRSRLANSSPTSRGWARCTRTSCLSPIVRRVSIASSAARRKRVVWSSRWRVTRSPIVTTFPWATARWHLPRCSWSLRGVVTL